MSAACSSPEVLAVRLFSPAGLCGFIPEWEALAASALEPNPFYEHWMLRPALEAFGGGQDVRIATVWSQGELLALLPLERVARYRGLPVAALRAWRHRHTLLCTPLIRAGREAQCLDALGRHLRSREGAALLELDFVPSEGPFHQAMQGWLHDAKLPSLSANGYERAVLRKAADAERYLAGLAGKPSRELKRRERRLAEQGVLTHVALKAGGDVERWVEDLMRLEAAGWKGERGSALASNETNRRFALAIFREAFRRGRLLMAGVDLDGKPLARCSSFMAGEGSFAFKTAYDEAFAAFSPGVIAEVGRIRRFHEWPGVQWMDSFTAPGNDVLDRVWKDRRGIQRLLVATRPLGEIVVAALPRLARLKARASSFVASAAYLVTRCTGNSRQPVTALGDRRRPAASIH
jgi:CelD/BcsL family acetyltransferase involved in cellulose biosynthesis